MNCSSAFSIDWILMNENVLCALYFYAHHGMLGWFVTIILRLIEPFDHRDASRKMTLCAVDSAALAIDAVSMLATSIA